ncbi:hypothetical protein [Streptomyces sp. NPDC005012]|uniref:hypothetical protein n=1 Tax=unclassified Streptomyces TaxID=2593676 RepID=UPI0033AF0D83
MSEHLSDEELARFLRESADGTAGEAPKEPSARARMVTARLREQEARGEPAGRGRPDAVGQTRSYAPHSSSSPTGPVRSYGSTVGPPTGPRPVSSGANSGWARPSVTSQPELLHSLRPRPADSPRPPIRPPVAVR